jgi:PST family polysaccharide transporter
VTFFLLVNDLGISAALIHARDLHARVTSTAFWTNVLLGFGLTALLFLAAPGVSGLLRAPEATELFQALSFCFLLGGATTTHRALLERELRFLQVAVVEASAVILATGIAIAAAVMGAGVWALIARTLVVAALQLAGIWLLSRWVPSLVYSWKGLKPLINYSLNVTGFNFVSYFSRRSDDLIITRVLGAQALGPYSLAYRVMLAPLENLSHMMARLLFPLMASLRHDQEKLRSAYLKTARGIATVSFPLMAGLMTIVDPFVNVVLGSDWSEVGLLILILAPIGAQQSISTLSGSVYRAMGETALHLKVAIAQSILIVASFLIGVNWGIVGVAAGYAIANLIILYPHFSIVLKTIGLAPWKLLKDLFPQLLASGVMAGGVLLADASLLSSLPDLGRILGAMLIGGTVYLTVMIHIDRHQLTELSQVLGLHRVPFVARILRLNLFAAASQLWR